MLTEIRKPRQIPDEPRRRWFHSPDMDLIVWFDQNTDGEEGLPIAFQLCYDKTHAEKALTWKAGRGFTHMHVDDGEAHPGKHKGAPLLLADGACDRRALGRYFAEAGKALPEAVRAFVTAKLSQTEEASLTMTPDTAPAHRDPDPC